ncbi:thioredoxin domain-containing protein [Candidatus Woesearchaeota archaeon]|nr:thioredoxin domain-containing protein [Candidatus Woesearchaeota archaeon]
MKSKNFGIIVLFIAFLVGSAVLQYNLEKKKNLGSTDVDADYVSKYLKNYPSYEKPFFGNEKAPLNFIAFIDMTKPSEKFFSETFPKLKEEYLDKSIVKFIGKIYLTSSDIKDNNERYELAKSLFCVKKIDEEKYYDFYFSIFNQNLLEALNKNNISSEQYENCIENLKIEDFQEIIFETEYLGIEGINARFYIGINDNTGLVDGIPNYDKFRKKIRNYELQIGI